MMPTVMCKSGVVLPRISWVRFEMESKIQIDLGEDVEVRPMKMEKRICSDVPPQSEF